VGQGEAFEDIDSAFSRDANIDGIVED